MGVEEEGEWLEPDGDRQGAGGGLSCHHHPGGGGICVGWVCPPQPGRGPKEAV